MTLVDASRGSSEHFSDAEIDRVLGQIRELLVVSAFLSVRPYCHIETEKRVVGAHPLEQNLRNRLQQWSGHVSAEVSPRGDGVSGVASKRCLHP